MRYAFSLLSMETSAVKMFDASGKIPSGLLEGTMNDMGSYDECLELTNASYCSVELRIPMPPRESYHSIGKPINEYFTNYSQENKVFHHLSTYAHYFYYLYYHIGICVPSECNSHDINSFIKTDSGLIVNSIECEEKVHFIENILNLNIHQFVSLIFVATIVVLVSYGTIHYALYRSDDSFFTAFALHYNFRKLTKIRERKNESFKCLHGLRIFSISWVVFGHCYGWINFQIFRRSFAASDTLTSLWFQPFMNGSLSVDTFFLISGFLTVYGSIIYFKSTKQFNILLYIFHRIMRFLPLLILTLSLTFLVPLAGSGPIWHKTIDDVIKNCAKNWWKNILFINHLVDSKSICLLHTWYIGCDFHFYVLALIVILPLLRRSKIGLINNAILLVLGSMISGYLLWKNKYPPTLLYAQPKVSDRLYYVLDFYIKPWAHIGPYCIGMFLGYLMSLKPPKSISLKYVTIGWIMTILSLLTILFSIYPWNCGAPSDGIYALFYGAIHRTLWAASIAWIIFACANGYGGIVNRILSWKPLILFSRLTYAIYLLHPLVHWMKLGTIRERIFLSHYDGLYAFISTLVLTIIFSMICSLMCESPFLTIEQRLLKRHFHLNTKHKPHGNELPFTDGTFHSEGNAIQNEENI